MDIARPGNAQNLLTLQEAALKLDVPVEVLLKWNEFDILTPKITLDGKIGYTQEQINQFLTIKQATSGQRPAFQDHSEAYHSPSLSASTSHISPKMFLTSVSLCALLGVVLFTLQPRFSDTLTGFETGYQVNSQTRVLGSQTSQDPLTQPIAFVTPSKLQDGKTNQQSNAFAKNIFATPTPFAAKSQKIGSPTKLVASLQPQTTPQPTIGQAVQTTYANTQQVGPSAAPHASFDENGNITGDRIKSNTLAAIIGTGMTDTFTASQTTTNVTNQIIFLFVGSFGALFMLLFRKRKPALSPAFQAIQSQPTPLEKIMEVKQKMDGTVVLAWDGKEYKVSKPEMDSDSDKFIEQIMHSMQSGMKEMEYENTTDTTRFSAPLSRIVTRLGFVGNKRNLFFPRTSKHRVLFRKYITEADLKSLNITPGEILAGLPCLS